MGCNTILLKPQGTTVWWKIREQKFIDYLCVKRCDSDGFSVFILEEVRSSDSSGPNSAPYGNFWVTSGALMMFVKICSWPYLKFCLLTVPCKWKCASLLIRGLFGRYGFSVNIRTNWRQNYKRISLSWLLKACTTCNMYGWRLRSLCRMRCTLLSDMCKAWACLHADSLRMRLTDGRHVTEPSSRHCFNHQRIAFGDGASCWFCSWRNPCWVSVTDPIQINSSTAHTRSLTPQHSMLTKSEGHCLCSTPALQDTLAEKHVTKILKCFTISAAPCIS